MSFKSGVIVCFFFLLMFSTAQLIAGRQLEILHADKLTMSEINGQRARLLEGNVGLLHQGTRMFSDKAYFYTDVNRVDAIGNVRIIDDEGTEMTADSVFYFGDTRMARARSNVRVVDSNMVLKTSALDYDLEKKTGNYQAGGELSDDKMVLTSRRGFLNTQTNQATFFGDVILIDPDYTIFADTLGYNTSSETATFYTNTRIVTRNQVIYCDRGTFRVNEEIAVFGRNTRVESPPQFLKSDSLRYHMGTGAGTSYRFFEWSDTTDKIIITGHYGEYHRESGYLMATNKPMLKSVLDNDTLFLVADTLVAGVDSMDYRYFDAFFQARFFREDLQGFADSISFSYADSVIKMFREPVLWQEQSQLTGDTIFIAMKDQKLHTVSMLSNAYIIEHDADEVFNQIKGRNIFGHFRDDALARMDIEGNAESIYFGKDDSDRYVGVNRALSSNMTLYFENGKVQRIHFLQSPDAGFYPLGTSSPTEYRLDGFNWRGEIRPLAKEDLLNPLTEPKEEDLEKPQRTGTRLFDDL